MPPSNSKAVMPDNDEAQPVDGGLVDAVVQHIKDDIDDHKTLREWRSSMAIVLLVVAAIFYGIFFCLLFVVFFRFGSL